MPTAEQLGQRCLHSFQQLVPAARAAFYRIDADLRPCDFQLRAMGARMHADYLDHYAGLDPLRPGACLATGLPVVPLALGMARQPLENRATYQAFLQQHGVIDVVEIIASDHARPLAGLSLLRRVGEAPFSSAELQRLHALQGLLELAALGLPQPGVETLPGLTAREREIALLLRDGASNKALARHLGIGLPTVKTHLLHLFRKLGVSSRTELVGKLLR
ncbi:MAG: putative HTH-type transcriptional regulator YhjB [Pseudomonas citronellolis]|nr:MAG: putative HTH-type transcriptional regulator YhjB [Pseudomonas citronellolis]